MLTRMLFFAAVEQYRNHPELAGKPLCVGHDPRGGQGRGVVRAASYEARAHGIKSGMPVSKAYRLCPEAAFVPGDFSTYKEASDEIMEVLREYADEGRVRRASIDEAYIEVTDFVEKCESPRALASEIQSAIRTRTRIPCSVGMAPNMSVAKVATGMNKPYGITVVNPGRVEEFLAPLQVDALNGLGKKTAERLARYGIETLGQIHSLSVVDLMPMMGKGAKWLHDRARGIDERPLIDNGPRVRKSISKDYTFMEDVEPDAIDFLHDSISKICKRIAERMQKKSLRFRTVTVKLRYADYTTIQRSKSIRVETDDAEKLSQLAIDLFNRKRDPDRYVRLIGVKVSSLSEHAAQCTLTEFM